MSFRHRIKTQTGRGDYCIIPTFAILDMDWADPYLKKYDYRFRLAFAWLNMRMSIGIGKRRGQQNVG